MYILTAICSPYTEPSGTRERSVPFRDIEKIYKQLLTASDPTIHIFFAMLDQSCKPAYRPNPLPRAFITSTNYIAGKGEKVVLIGGKTEDFSISSQVYGPIIEEDTDVIEVVNEEQCWYIGNHKRLTSPLEVLEDIYLSADSTGTLTISKGADKLSKRYTLSYDSQHTDITLATESLEIKEYIL